jgi:hypothetical protein
MRELPTASVNKSCFDIEVISLTFAPVNSRSLLYTHLPDIFLITIRTTHFPDASIGTPEKRLKVPIPLL